MCHSISAECFAHLITVFFCHRSSFVVQNSVFVIITLINGIEHFCNFIVVVVVVLLSLFLLCKLTLQVYHA